MKAFRFPLQAILTLRDEQEQEALRGYARTLRAVEAVRDAIAAVLRELDGAGSEQSSRLRAGVPALELQRLLAYRTVLEARHAALRLDLARAERDAEVGRLGLLKASQNRQTLEKYREKLQRTHAAQVVRAERVLLDDLAGRPPALAAAWRQSSNPAAP